MNYNWNWGILITDPYFDWIISGLGWTLAVSICSWLIAFFLGSVVGIIRTVNQPVIRALGAMYVEVFRNIPLIVQMFLWYFIFPEVLPEELGTWVKRGIPMPQFWTAVICLGTYTASRVAEQVRAGINAIGTGQRQAAEAIGLSPVQVYLHVLLPVSYRTIIPPLTSEFLGIFKNSSVALTIGVMELTAQTRQIEVYTFQGFEAFTAATAIYISVTFIVMAAMAMVEKKMAVPGMISRGNK